MKNNLLEFECGGIDSQGNFNVEYTGYGQNISPQFIIKNLSPKAKTIAVTLEDISHPINNFTHWIIWNIPATDVIEKALSHGKIISTLGNARQGIAYGWHRYAGPKPPKKKNHLYKFTLYTLDCEMNISSNTTKRGFLKKAESHILQCGEIIGGFAADNV